MTNPHVTVANATQAAFVPRGPVTACLASVTAVNTTTGTCTIDTGDGAALAGVIYVGPAPTVGRQVVYLVFDRTGVVLGGG